MLLTILVTAGPTGTITVYIPVESKVTVCVMPELSVITTSTPGIPGSPGSQMPFAFLSSNMIPLILPVGWKPSLLVAVLLAGTMTVIRLEPAVCSSP